MDPPRPARDSGGVAPWPPHYRKQEGEPRRAPPSTALSSSKATQASTASKAAPAKRKPTKPLIEIARADREAEALAAVEAWKERHPKAAAHLQPADVLVDRMRGSSSLWYRVRINLEHVPARQRPKGDKPDAQRE